MPCQTQLTTATTCSAIAPGFATFASARPPANVMYPQPVGCNKLAQKRINKWKNIFQKN